MNNCDNPVSITALVSSELKQEILIGWQDLRTLGIRKLVSKATIVVTEEHKEITCMGSFCSKDAPNVTNPAEMTELLQV